MNAVYRPAFGRFITVVIGAIAAVAATVTAVAGSGRDFLGLAPWLVLLAGACWATFWRPRVEVSDGGVRIVNVTRTIDIPWPAITAIETRWALTLHTAYGKYTAWAAPAPGRGPARKAAMSELRLAGRPVGRVFARGDIGPGPASEAADIIRDRWERLKAAGHLEDPVLEHERAPVRWHIGTMAAGLAVVGVGIVGLIA